MKDIYFEPSYGKLYEEIEGGKSIHYKFESEYGSISNLFIIRKIPIDIQNGEVYYDITTPYGYGGPIIENVKVGKKNELLTEYYNEFENYCIENNIVSEFIRFHPLFNNANDFSSIYDVKYMRKTIGTNLKAYDDPFQAEFSKSARKNVRRSLREGVTYKVITNPSSIDEFLEIYQSTMDRNKADSYYYFDKEYFVKHFKYLKNNILLVKAFYQEKTIAIGFYYKYKKILHTHLSGTLTEYLHLSPAYILRYALSTWGKENGYHLIHHGGATSNDQNDSLYKFKKRFGKNTEFDFNIGTKIWNREIYKKLCEEINIETNYEFFPMYRN